MSDQKFDPMKEIANLRNSVGKVIEQGIQTVQNAANPASSVRLDIYELDGNIVVRTAPFDNLDPASIEVNMEGEVLTISGVTRPDDTPPDASFLLQERRFGPFTRQVTIRIPVKSTEARAKLKNGSLTITLPIDKEGFHDIEVTPTD